MNLLDNKGRVNGHVAFRCEGCKKLFPLKDGPDKGYVDAQLRPSKRARLCYECGTRHERAALVRDRYPKVQLRLAWELNQLFVVNRTGRLKFPVADERIVQVGVRRRIAHLVTFEVTVKGKGGAGHVITYTGEKDRFSHALTRIQRIGSPREL